MQNLSRLRIPVPSPGCATRFSALLLTATLLGGCALSPGVEFAGSMPHADPLADLDSTPQTDSGTPTKQHEQQPDQPPQNAIREITPELIRQMRNAQPKDVAEGVKRLFGTAQPYRIGPADILNIVVWDHPTLMIPPAGSITTDAVGGAPVSNGYNVSANGFIQFPYIGDVKVSGLTEYQVRDELTKRLSKYLNQPKLTVRIQSYRSGRVYVDGAVRQPGLQAVNDIPMTLPEAINRAGGFAPDADRSAINVSRGDTTVSVDLQQLTRFGINPSKIILSSGDLVRVMSRDDAKVYILGEVSKPTAQPLRNGRLSLNEALGEAGGVNPTSGNPKQIFVVRADNDPEHPQIFHLDAQSPAAYALSEGFELKPSDVVYVDPAAVVRWNRVISMIVPSAQVMYYGNQTTK